jgi:hypothetical protein
VEVHGEHLEHVTVVELASLAVSSPPEILAPNRLRFVTDAHAPGVVGLALRDEWGGRVFESSAYEFVGPPRLSTVYPPPGSKHGGTVVTLTGESLRPNDSVEFGGLAVVSVAAGPDGTLEVTTAPHALGVVDVRVEDPWGRVTTLLGAFEFTEGSFADVTEDRMPGNESAPTGDLFFGGKGLALGELDGDGDADLLVWDVIFHYRRGSFEVDLPLAVHVDNVGRGDFTDYRIPVGDALPVDDLALGDLDGDGDLDTVVTTDHNYTKTSDSYTRGSVSYHVTQAPRSSTRVLLNQNNGRLKQYEEALPDPRPDRGVDLMQGVSIAVGDVDGDDDLDLVVTQDRSAGRSDWTTYTYWSGGTYHVNKYFTTEYSDAYPATRVLLNDGRARFADATATALPGVGEGDLFAGDAVLLADVDGDDDLDILVSGDGEELRDAGAAEYVAGSKTRVLVNDGTGVFTNATTSFLPPPKGGDDWGGVALAMGDLDGDGADDLVVAVDRVMYSVGSGGARSYLPSTRVFGKGDEEGLEETTAAILPAVRVDGSGDLWKAADVAIADPEGNGRLDLFLVSEGEVKVIDETTGEERTRSSLRWLRNLGDGPLSDATEEGMPDAGDRFLGGALLLGDVDGDSDLDLMVTTTLPSYEGAGRFPTRLLEFK